MSHRTKPQYSPECCIRCSILPSAGPFLFHLDTAGPGRKSRNSPGRYGWSGGAGSEEAGANQYLTGGCSESSGEQTGPGEQGGGVKTTDLHSHTHIICVGFQLASAPINSQV